MSRDTRSKQPKKGFKMSPEAVEKRNASRRRNNPNWFSEATIEKLRKAQIGRVYDKQARQNMAEAQFRRHRKGESHKPTIEQRAKISYARRKKRPLTDEEKEALSYKMKLFWERKRAAEKKK